MCSGKTFGPTAAALGTLGVLVALLVVPLPRELESPTGRHVLDLAHAPLFFVVFLVARASLKQRMRYAEPVAAALAALLGGLSELVQGLGSREASGPDLAVDILGVALAWSGVRCWRRGGRFAAGHAIVVAVFFLAAATSVAQRVRRDRDLAGMMPLVAGFEKPYELDRWEAKAGTRIRRTTPGLAGSAWALEVRCAATEAWPGVSIEGFESDWNGYRWLEWSLRLPSGEPLELAVRIDDDSDTVRGARLTAYVTITPGQEVYRLDLHEAAARSRERPMSLSRVTELHFFLDNPRGERVFWLDEVRLVP